MNSTSHRISVGALALIVALALPAGLLSIFSSVTTGEEIDAADTIVTARISAVQKIDKPATTILTMEVGDVVVGSAVPYELKVTVPGSAPVDVGDDVVALFDNGTSTLMRTYDLEKDDMTLEFVVTTPLTGMSAQGIASGQTYTPMSAFTAAVRSRRGITGGQVIDSFGGQGGEILAVSGPDAFEPNDTLATATSITVGLPTPVTGMPTLVSGLNLDTTDDVDFFEFQISSLSVLHAETLDAGTGFTPDTLLGVFDATTGELLGFDDDSGAGKLSRILQPIAKGGPHAVAVESAPDANLDFTGDDGATTGDYTLSLELERGSYIWNNFDMIAGLSEDGSFIEDFIGTKDFGGEDVLLVGVPADGWAVSYDVNGLPTGVTSAFGGGGDQLSDPGFTSTLLPVSFKLGPFIDLNGLNRQGRGVSKAVVPYNGAGDGVSVEHDFKIGRSERFFDTDLTLRNGTSGGQAENLVYTRVADIDLFGVGADNFAWTFDPAASIKAFPVDTSATVGNVTPPASSTGTMVGDMQLALLIDQGSMPPGGVGAQYKLGFTYVTGEATEFDALEEAQRNLTIGVGVTTWVIATDQDPDTGLWAAYGAGLGE